MINLDAPGTILFFGTMNAMPMMYARELRRLGQDVVYFVDVPKTESLSRPECHYEDIGYPYPEWIVEFPLKSSLLANLLPRAVLKRMLRKAAARSRTGAIKAVFMGGSFVALAPHLPDEAIRVFLSYGGDLDVWCNRANTGPLFRGMRNLSLFRYLPASLARGLLERVVARNYAAARECDALLYFPRGVNRAGDRLIGELEAAGVAYVTRYAIAFDKLDGVDRAFKPAGDKLVIVSPVRFLFRSLHEGNPEYSKGNEKIIEGLARYKRVNPDIEVHFVEKGLDYALAKQLCDAAGLADTVIWHKEMPFIELARLYASADICIDQVGDHLIGTGLEAMYLGKPLIANAANLAFLGETPIMSARTAEEMFRHLVTLRDEAMRKDVSARSRAFVEAKLGAGGVLEKLLQAPRRNRSRPNARD